MLVSAEKAARVAATLEKAENELLVVMEVVERKEVEISKRRKEMLRVEPRASDLKSKYEMADEQLIHQRKTIMELEARLKKYQALIEEVDALREKERSHSVDRQTLQSEIEKRDLRIEGLRESFETEKKSLELTFKLELQNEQLKWELGSYREAHAATGSQESRV